MAGTAVRISGLALSLMFLASLTALAYAVSAIHAPGPAADEVTLVLPRGTGLNAIADMLEAERVVRSALLFGFWIRVTGDAGALQAGEYRFPAAATAAEVAAMLEEGRTHKRRLTVAEGLSTDAVRVLVEAAEGLEGDWPDGVAEGNLLPETYLYERGDARSGLVARMAEAMDEALAQLWADRASGLALDTPAEALILASMVEKETGLAEERPIVAGVFLNRLERGMRLQSDPTVAYGLRREGKLTGPLTRADLERDHPFNTYLIPALPPSPIANPGRAAIEAALHPGQTDFLYFVADGQGGHLFATTLEEHNRNVAGVRQQ